MATDETPPAWVVTSQQETTDLAPDGTYKAGVRVTFRTAAGTLGSVFLTHQDYTLDVARRTIAERAAVLDAVSGLTG